MGFSDKSLQCSDCGASFVFTAAEQEFYAARGYANEPKRCPSCREARKAERYGSGSYRPRRQMFTAVCAECGGEAQVPFEPRGDRPVYCSSCYTKLRQGSQR
jgi:CxxC-x17-CxxC domain-containing protein